MAYTEIIYTVEDMVGTITLNRPERMNALTRTTYQEAEEAIREADADEGVRAVIITGAGRGFCSGDDVKEMAGAPSPEELAKIKIPSKAKPTPLAEALLTFDKPLIAAVNGAAVGWGMDLALMCDIRLASEKAKFGEVYVLRGLVADIAGWLLLPQIVGLSKAYELLLTGDVIDAQEAERIGLVSKTLPHDELMPVAEAMAKKIAANPPVAVRMTKEAVRRGLDYNLGALGEYHSYALKTLFATEDFKEGSTAVLERRQPTFKGR
jgi:enoyl-CoA hydratase/carnithine racemase